MKKFYIQPSIEIEIMDASDLLAGSPKWESETYDGTQITPQTKIQAGDESKFAKGNNFWGFDEEDFDEEYD